jgi:anaerobic selenocysteine-containing dehydrogenase
MEERGWWLPEHKEFDSFWNELIERGGWTDLLYDDADPGRLARTRDGRISLIPAELLAVLSAEGDSRRPYVDVTTPADEAPEEFPLRLVPYRASVFPNVHWVPWVEVHPETAHSLGLGDNTMVWVISQQGRYRARLKLFHGTAHENVCAPYGLRHPELANPLQLLSGSRDSLTGLPAWFSTYVRLERA